MIGHLIELLVNEGALSRSRPCFLGLKNFEMRAKKGFQKEKREVPIGVTEKQRFKQSEPSGGDRYVFYDYKCT